MSVARCVVCLTPCSRYWHRYCAQCRAWLRFEQALRVIQATAEARR